MSDSVKAWHEMSQDEKLKYRKNNIEVRKYLWVLDFEEGRVFMYNINRTDLEHEHYEDIMELKGHNTSNCEWMICKSDKIYN